MEELTREEKKIGRGGNMIAPEMKDGEVREYKGKRYMAVEVYKIMCGDCIDRCVLCSGREYCYNLEEIPFKEVVGECPSEGREDLKEIIFLEING